VDPGDARVVYRREGLGLPLEAPQAFAILGELHGQHLDRDLALEAP
jgi:hypothetical protein